MSPTSRGEVCRIPGPAWTKPPGLASHNSTEGAVTTSEGEAVAELTIPGSPEYVSVARLAIRGVGSRMRFSYDEVEDIRLAVGEACTNVMDRASDAHVAVPEVRVRCLIDPSRL